MPYYRLYFLTEHPLSGRLGVARVVEFNCESDDEARAEAEQHRDGSSMELWNQSRMVTAFPAT